MLQRLNVRDSETPETARRRFDGQLGVRSWAAPGNDVTEPEQIEAATPWWWDGAEQASQSFLAAMGVNLK